MSEPANDMTLIRPPPMARLETLDVYPLRRMTHDTEPAQWTRYSPATDERREYWTITRPVCLHLPGYCLLPCCGDGWHAHAKGLIYLAPGWQFDGASGPAIDDPAAIMASAPHDIVCAWVPDGRGGLVHPLRGYYRRHALYSRILEAQGEHCLRCAWSLAGLLCGNWIVDIAARVRYGR
jgi:hypothetical protein